MQNAEENPIVRHGKKRTDRDDDGSTGNITEPSQIGFDWQPVTGRQSETNTDDKKKTARDTMREQTAFGRELYIVINNAEKAEIPCEMEEDHGDNGNAPRDIDHRPTALKPLSQWGEGSACHVSEPVANATLRFALNALRRGACLRPLTRQQGTPLRAQLQR